MAAYRGGDAEKNPFVLPSDEEVFRMRDTERRTKAMERERQGTLKVWEKTTGSAALFRSAKIDELMGEDMGVASGGARSRALVAAARTVLGGQDAARAHKPEKENMGEFIAKKREMFLVQMSLDTKREEIRKLEEKAAMKEEALKKSEQMLEEDAIRFDTFLKENDKKAHDAIKHAERETKLKQDKVAEIKRLNQAIQAVQSDISKHRESLDDCLRFKAFLDGLTPKDFFDAEARAKAARQAHRRSERTARQLEAWAAAQVQQAADFEARQAAEHDALLAKGTSKKKAAATVAAMRPPKPPARPPVEEEPLTSSGAEPHMYFEAPRQLMDEFTQLEAQNLFLIQNSQETEQALEELRAEFKGTQAKMGRKTEALQATIGELSALIGAEERKESALDQKVAPAAEGKGGKEKGGPLGMSQEEVLNTLHQKVLEVYKKCGFDVSGGSPSTLFMLSELEARLEDLLAAMGAMPAEYVRGAEKGKDKQRRDRKRAELQAEQERVQEERNRKSNERSMMAPAKRTGRAVMFRSKPLSKKATIGEAGAADDGQAGLDDLRFFTDD